MELLVDGYNLFKQVVGASLLSSTQMAHYIALFSRYVQKKELTALLVFDGGMQERPLYQEHGMVQVIYVGKNKTADDFIKDYLQQCAHKNMLLVSSDRELNRVADYYNVPSIDVLDFWYFVRQALAKKEQQVPILTYLFLFY